jgi:GTP cyclohydrolase I
VKTPPRTEGPARRAPDLARAARAIEQFLRAIGAPVDDDPELKDTPRRVAEAFAEDLLSGYDADPAAILADATASSAPGLVIVSGIATSTTCPHHLMPASGVVHVGYLPGDRVVGLGAIGRLVDCFARRLMLQEDLGQHVVEALVDHLGARGAGAVVDLAPTCMTARGDRRHGARALTFAYGGVMAEEPSLQQQLLSGLAVAGRDIEP